MAATQKFTNSGLVTYTKLSSHNSGRRTMNIDTITIHTMAGNMTAENCAIFFASDYTQASSNYTIGSDGHIALSVPEEYRSWCSSSAANDQRAITIEVASLTTTEPFPCSEAAWNALVDLCTDICQRNNIKELKWKADKSLIGQPDKQNLTVHRWFAAKSCPGEYLYQHMGDLASQVNKRLNSSSLTISDTTVNNLTKTTAEEYIWSFLKGKLYNEFAVAGIMGCMYAESGFIANNLENSKEKVLNLTDEKYTLLVDKGAYTKFATDKCGYGLCQWTYDLGKKRLLDFAKKKGKSVGDLYTQLEFFYWDITTNFKSLYETLTKVKDITTATSTFLNTYEYGGKAPNEVLAKRLGYAKTFYTKYHTTTSTQITNTTKVPYMVKVTTNQLRVRKGPGTNYDGIAIIKDKGVYTIIEESTGNGAKKWGKLKAGGWIALDYCEIYKK